MQFLGDPYKKFDPEQRRIREKEREAVVMMQRAYRNHLARTRSARKYTGLSKETQEWARTYKRKYYLRGFISIVSYVVQCMFSDDLHNPM